MNIHCVCEPGSLADDTICKRKRSSDPIWIGGALLCIFIRTVNLECTNTVRSVAYVNEANSRA